MNTSATAAAQRKSLMPLRRQAIEDMPAIELPQRKQIQSRRQKTDPCGEGHRVKQQRLRFGPRMKHRDEERISAGKP